MRPPSCNFVQLAMEDWGCGSWTEALQDAKPFETAQPNRKAMTLTEKAKAKIRRKKEQAKIMAPKPTPSAASSLKNKAEAKRRKAAAEKKKAKAKAKTAKAKAKKAKGKPQPRPVQGSPNDRAYSSNMPYHFSADVALRPLRGLNLASDCSGWCCEGLAAEMVSDEHINHVFASDTSAAVRTPRWG